MRFVDSLLVVVVAALICCRRVDEPDPTRNPPPRTTSSVPAAPPAATLTVENGKLMLKGALSAETAEAPGPRVKHIEVSVGNGPAVNEGNTIKLQYSCALENGAVVESTKPGEPLVVTLGEKKIIEGFETGIPGMRVGGKRQLNVPPNRAYGAVGKPPAVPPNARLFCDLEVVDLVAKP